MTRAARWCRAHDRPTLAAGVAALLVVIGISSVLGTRTSTHVPRRDAGPDAVRTAPALTAVGTQAVVRDYRTSLAAVTRDGQADTVPASTSLGTLGWVGLAAAIVLLLLAFGSIFAAGLPW